MPLGAPRRQKATLITLNDDIVKLAVPRPCVCVLALIGVQLLCRHVAVSCCGVAAVLPPLPCCTMPSVCTNVSGRFVLNRNVSVVQLCLANN